MHVQGGFGSAVLKHLTDLGHLDLGTLRARSMVVPDISIEGGPQTDQYDIAGLNHPHIAHRAATILESIRNYK